MTSDKQSGRPSITSVSSDDGVTKKKNSIPTEPPTPTRGSFLNRNSSIVEMGSVKKPELQRRSSFALRSAGPQNFKFSDALEKAENDNSEDKDSLEDMRLQTKKYMTHSTFGQYYENIMLFISVVSCLEFIYATYLEPDNRFDHANKYVLLRLDFFFAATFAADYTLNFLLADRKLQFMTSFFSVVDLTTIIPIFVTWNQRAPDLHEVRSAESIILYILFGLKTTRVLRSLRTLEKLNTIHDAVDRYIGEISLSISVMILFFASVMQYLERSVHPYPFHTWMYYIWVTIATVGYGDISPVTPVGRFFAMFMIGFAIISVPKMTNGLIEKMNLQSVYARAVYTPKSRSSRHIVICGDLSSTSLVDFFEELFHEDHENADLNAVILLPSPPTVEILLMLRDPKYMLSLSYLQGSSLTDVDLKRSKAETAVAIFIMTNKFSSVPDEEDAKSVLQNLSIKRYFSASLSTRSEPLYCMQLIRPENLRQLSRGSAGGEENNLVVCLNEIKMGVLARAIVYPGANTFIMNLITSFSDDAFAEEPEASSGPELSLSEGSHKMQSAGSFKMTPGNSSGGSGASMAEGDSAWLKEYQKGCDWEIYTTSLSDIFVGAKFAELSLALYEKLGVVLFALQITHLTKKGQSKLLLNPASFIIPDKREFRIEAFVIAKNKATSDLSFTGRSSHENTAFHAVAGQIVSVASVIKSTVTNDDRRRLSSVLDSQGGALRKPIGKSDNVSEEGSEKKEVKKASKWNSLKRSSLLDKKVQSFSYQEILQRLEDEHFQKFYYLRAVPVELSDITVKTGVIEEIPFINNHIIVIGKELSNLYDLIKPLRAKYLGTIKYIVILYPFDVPYEVWQRICMFDAVLVVRGSPLEETNLRRAGIFRAQQVVVLAEGSNSNSEASGMEALVDSDAIFAYQCVKRMNPNTQVVVEIVNQSNIGYLVEQTAHTSNGDYKNSNQFAAGTLFTTSLLDSLVCQAYYNPHIIKVVNKLISGVDQMERAGLTDQAMKEAAESGTAGDKANNKSDSEDSGDDHDAFSATSTKIKSKINAIKGSCLYQIAMPENFLKKNYGQLYHYLAMQGIIPLGLLRGTVANLNIGSKGNRMPYVFTNPEKTAELFPCDRVFVLACSPQTSQGKGSVKDWLLDLQMQKNREKEAEKAPSTPGGPLAPGVGRPGSAFTAGGMEGLQASQKKLEEKFVRLSKDMNNKFTSIVSLLKAVITHLPGTEDLDLDQLLDPGATGSGKLTPNRANRGISVDSQYTTMTSNTAGSSNGNYHGQRRHSLDSASSAMTRDSISHEHNENDSQSDGPDCHDINDPRQTPVLRGRKHVSSNATECESETEVLTFQQKIKLQAKKNRLDALRNDTQHNTQNNVTSSPTGILRKTSRDYSNTTADYKLQPIAASQQRKRHSFSDPVVQSVSHFAAPLEEYSSDQTEEKEGRDEVERHGRVIKPRHTTPGPAPISSQQTTQNTTANNTHDNSASRVNVPPLKHSTNSNESLANTGVETDDEQERDDAVAQVIHSLDSVSTMETHVKTKTASGDGIQQTSPKRLNSATLRSNNMNSIPSSVGGPGRNDSPTDPVEREYLTVGVYTDNEQSEKLSGFTQQPFDEETDQFKQFSVKSKPSPRTYSSGQLSNSNHNNSNSIHSKRGVSASAILSGPPIAMVRGAATQQNRNNAASGDNWLGMDNNSNHNPSNNNGSYFNNFASFAHTTPSSPSKYANTHTAGYEALQGGEDETRGNYQPRSQSQPQSRGVSAAKFSGPPVSKDMFK